MDELSEQITEEIAELEPQVTSSDPNERKLARKLRIERRLEALRRQKEPKHVNVEVEEKDKTLSQIQIERSVEILKKLLDEGEERVTNIRIANDAREAERRETEGINREKIIGALEDEANLAAETFKQISDKWLTILKSNDPLNINDRMVQQKEKCEELMKQKDGIIAMLKDEINTSEKKFGIEQRKQIDDICLLTNRIEKQILLTKRAYREQLQLIEEAMQEERRVMMELNAKKWEELYKKRDQEEEASSNKKYEQMEEFDNQMTMLRREFQEKYRETKIRLERDIDELEQELERIKALAILNSEKLDYNYQILKKREDENIIIKSQQKRRINKLQDIVNTLKRKITEYSDGTKQQIVKVTGEISKLQKSILDIESKADHFAEINDVKFNQLWDMNTERVLHVAKRILTIDKILHEQLLGLPWTDQGILKKKELKKENLPSYKEAIETLEEEAGTVQPHKSMMAIKSRKNLELDPEKELVRKNLLKRLMQEIADKAGFILEDRLQKVLEPFVDTEKTLIRMDNVFSALNITKEADIDLMFEYFLPYTHCPICSVDVDKSMRSEIESELAVLMSGSIELSVPKQHVSLDTTGTARSMDTAASRTSEDVKRSSERMKPASSFIPVTHLPEHAVNVIMTDLLEPEVEDAESSESDEDQPVETFETLDPLDNMPPSRVGPVAITEDDSSPEEDAVEKKLSCQYHHPLVISSVYVLKALRHFVNNYYKQKADLPTMQHRLNRQRKTICRLVNENDIKTYWEQFRNIFPEENENVWNALSDGLTHYHEILKDRKLLHDEVVELRQQNLELKNMLERYIEDPDDPMLKPPCALQRNTPPRLKSRKL